MHDFSSSRPEMKFWDDLDQLVSGQDVVIDRPKGSRHPTYGGAIYPLDYGHLTQTTSNDRCEIDIWAGSENGHGVTGVICTVDLKKKDAELKLLLDCTEEEMKQVEAFHGEVMSGLLITRPRN